MRKGYKAGQQDDDERWAIEVGESDAGCDTGPSTSDLARWIQGSDERLRTIIIVNLASIMERIDEALLPAVWNSRLYRFVGRTFQATPSQLGWLTLSRAITQALASPFAGLLGHFANRVYVLTAGAVIWGCMTAGFALTSSVWAGMPFWAVNGLGLSFLIPTAQSLVADYNTAGHRGRAFGLLHLTGAMGGMLGALYATNIGHLVILDVEGWRFAFLTVAVASLIIAVLTRIVAVDPRYSRDKRYRIEAASDWRTAGWRDTASEVWSVVTVPSFIIIVSQGIMGTTPWNALVFLTFYLELLGMGDLWASLLVALFMAANAAGGLLGGHLGDAAAARWPDHGRVAVCQLSVGLGIPLATILFKGLPLTGSGAAIALYAIVLILTGLSITWAATACNNPIFAEIVPPRLRNLAYSFDRSFEGAIAALGAPLVGKLAEKVFGFQGNAELSDDPAANLKNAVALGNALLCFTIVPWALCALFFTGLHYTYPRDKVKAQRLEADKVALSPVTEVELVEGDEERQRRR